MLGELYLGLTRREYVHPDPLEFLYRYDEPADREVVAVVASSLAFGQVRQILRSVETVLTRLGPRPAKFLVDTSPGRIRPAMRDFQYRFVRGENIAALLIALRTMIKNSARSRLVLPEESGLATRRLSRRRWRFSARSSTRPGTNADISCPVPPAPAPVRG
jgi:hypothetical protein